MSLRVKVLLPLFLFSLLFFLFLYGYWMPRSLANMEREHHDSLLRHLDSVAEGLIPLLLGHQLDTVYENLDSLRKKNHDWKNITLENKEGRTLYPLHPSGTAGDSDEIHTLQKQIKFGDMNLGRLNVQVDFGPRLLEMKRRHRELMAALAGITGIFILTMAVMLERIVGRPVRLLAHASGKLAGGDFNVMLPGIGDDEVGTLVKSFSGMRDAISGYQAELIQRNLSLTKLSLAVEQSPVSIVITDSRGTIEFVNPKFTQVTGYGAEEVIGGNMRILKSGETSPEEYRNLWETISSGNVWHGQFHNRKKNGELFWEEASISPVRNHQGVITHYLAIKEDITERRQLEDQLRQAQKMEAIGQLAGGIAHDFNNMLTAIIGYGNLLRTDLHGMANAKVYLDQILMASEKAANLTRGLLAFSRKQELRLKPVDLNVVIRSMERLLQRVIGEEAELRTVLADRDVTVLADSGQLDQVLMNLVTNARDALSGKGVLEIETGVVRIENDYAKFHADMKIGEYGMMAVHDNGVGMDAVTREKIFEPFFTTKAPGKGTGLGLSIVYGIIKQHNGIINVYSEPGKGTSFRIYLPLQESAVTAEKAELLSAMKGGNETVLLADDSEEVRKIMKELLTMVGYRVIEAVDGEDAVSKFRENGQDIDLLILDVIMPKLNGREVFQEIENIRPGIRTIFSSGYTSDIIQAKGISNGDIDLILKPISPTEFLGRVRKKLDSPA